MISKIVKMILNVEQSGVAKPSPWLASFFGGRPSATGQNVTTDTAMQVSVVYACIRVLSDSVASLPLKVFEKLENGGKRQALGHPLYSILKSTPNPEMTSFDMRELIMLHLGLRGNAFHQIIRDGAMRVKWLYPLHPDRMTVLRDPVTKELVYRYQQEVGGQRDFKANEIWRVNGIGGDGIIGFSPIALHREAIGLAMATEEHGSRMFSNGAQIPSVLEYPGKLSPEYRKNLQESFAQKYSGSANAYKTPILEDGIKLTAVGLKADEAQFLQTRKFQISEIARIYRVPPHLVGDLEKATFSNIEQQSLEFVIHSLRPWLVRIEQSIERDLFTAAERTKYFVQFDIEGLLRGDSKARAEFYKSGILNGYLSRNEVRRKENFNAAPGLGDFLVPLNMGVVGKEAPVPQPSERTRAIVHAAATRVINKEVKAITKIINSDGDHLEQIKEFYDSHQKFVMDVLAVDGDFTCRYVDFQKFDLAFGDRKDTLANWQREGAENLTNHVLSLEAEENAEKK